MAQPINPYLGAASGHTEETLAKLSSAELHALYLSCLAESVRLGEQVQKHERELARLRPLFVGTEIAAKGIHRRFMRAAEREAKDVATTAKRK